MTRPFCGRAPGVIAMLAALLFWTATAPAHAAGLPAAPHPLVPGNLLVSTAVYQNDPSIVAGQTQLPAGCGTNKFNTPCGTAVTDGTYPFVFNNESIDSTFSVTSPIVLEQLDPAGHVVGTITVPDGGPGRGAGANQMVTSFSSKSELALNLSTEGKNVTFLGYDAAPDTTDVSNSSTPGDVDPTDPVVPTYYRVVGQLNQDGDLHFTETNAFSGDNGRAAIENDRAGLIYAAGNAGDGANPQPQGVVQGAGAQLVQPSQQPESKQNPGQPVPVGSFNTVEQLGFPSEKVAKDNNYRGIAVSNNVLYYTKGSGSNGVDTVYFVDTTGTACPTGVGLPVPGAPLPTGSSITFNASEGGANNPGLEPQNMCILKGFPQVSAKNADDSSDYPFGIWFANADTIYIADEGAGDNAFDGTRYNAAAGSTTAGLQKWVFDPTSKSWQLAYTLQDGLQLGVPYTVPGYPTGLNNGPGGTGLPWSPATDGLRALTGRVNPDGTVTLWAVTSTVSGSGDQGADPNKLVSITDRLGATTLPGGETFNTIETAPSGSLLRGVSFTPGTGVTGRS